MRLPIASLIACLVVANLAPAETIIPISTWYELSPTQHQKLERTACLNPYKLRLHSAYGDRDLPDDQTDFDARALCETHRYIDNNPAAYELDCEPTADDWKCNARETITATFPDRQVFIISNDASLDDAYAIIRHLVTIQAFEPGTYSNDLFERIDGPHDECTVKGLTRDTFDVECQRFSARIQRDTSSGTTKYVRR